MPHFAAECYGQGAEPVCRRSSAFLATTVCFLLMTILCVLPAVNTDGNVRAALCDDAHPGWVSMPAGARSAYLGIHGGTVPVSLLVTNTGKSLVSFVGQTGNDFLALLRKAELRLPSFLNNATESREGESLISSPKALVSAGSTDYSLPVIKLPDDNLLSLSSRPGLLQPFGFSDRPLGIEGDVTMPRSDSLLPRYHILVEPNYLMPR